MASRLEKVKNIELAIQALYTVVKKHENVALLIAGDGSARKSLEDLVTKLKLEKNVIFLGWKENVSEYMKSADMFLNTSKHEGYCLSLIEAGRLKCPILTTDVGVVGEVLNESNAMICAVGDLDCITESITKGVESAELLLELRNKAFVDILGITPTKEHYLAMYRKSFEDCNK